MKAEIISVKDQLEGFGVVHYVTFKTAEKCDFPRLFELTIQSYSPNRKMSQNDKFHAICGEIARLICSSKTEVKNWLLKEYGEYKRDKDGEIITVILPEDYPFEKDDELHLDPTEQTFTSNGKTYRKFYQLLNSSSMNTKQMGRLIEGAEYELRCIKEE